jgi:hypothetical protein
MTLDDALGDVFAGNVVLTLLNGLTQSLDSRRTFDINIRAIVRSRQRRMVEILCSRSQERFSSSAALLHSMKALSSIFWFHRGPAAVATMMEWCVDGNCRLSSLLKLPFRRGRVATLGFFEWGWRKRGRRFNAEAFHFLEQRGAVQAQKVGGLLFVSPVDLQTF